MKEKAIETPEEAEQQRERREEKERQLGLAYGRFGASEDGRLILADLMRRFGWKNGIEAPCYHTGITPEDAIHRDGMKEPVRYILSMSGKGIVIETQNPNEK